LRLEAFRLQASGFRLQAFDFVAFDFVVRGLAPVEVRSASKKGDCCAVQRGQTPSHRQPHSPWGFHSQFFLKLYTTALRNVAINAAAPMNNPANVRFMRFCCLGVRNNRSSRDANPV